MNPSDLTAILPELVLVLAGGVLVLANIRGGGEYGPQWHQAALKKNRHRAYEDFVAVAPLELVYVADLTKMKDSKPEDIKKNLKRKNL